jgi:hypothetical protein
MNTSIRATRISELAYSSPESIEDHLNIAVVYSDDTSLNKAVEIQRRVLQEFDSDHVHSAWWAMESLQREELFEYARHEAAGVDILFVAIPSSMDLSFRIKTWLAAVLEENSRKGCALVALLGSTDDPSSGYAEAEDYLHELAERSGIKYFVYWYQLPPAQSSSLLDFSLGTSALTPDAVQRWGLNE